MANSTYTYRIEIPLSIGINSVIYEDELCEANIILLHDSATENHRLLAKVLDGNYLMESLILEVSFAEQQNIEKLFKNAKHKLNKYLSTIKYLACEYSVSLVERETLIVESFNHTEKQRYQYADIIPVKYSGIAKEIKYFTKDKFEWILNAASDNLENYIAIYVDVVNLSDPVAKLIGFASLFELIQYDNKEMGLETPQIDPLAKAARDLVAHGVLRTNRNTIDTLNNHFGTNVTSHQFSRNNTKHIELVHWAINKYNSYLKEFIPKQLPPRNFTFYVNP